MDWLLPVDIYCERTDPSFWAEPLNAISNLAFLLAAGLAARRAAPPAGRADRPVLALAGLVAVIGVGSFLFHTFANRWSALADVIPIAIFIYAYFALAMRRFFRLGWGAAAAAVISFGLASAGLDAVLPRAFLNGSGSYLPAWAAMLVIGALLRRRGAPEAGPVLAAAAVFTLSLVFRSLDEAVCPALPIGVHYLWHMLNALTLFLLLEAARRSGPRGVAGNQVPAGL